MSPSRPNVFLLAYVCSLGCDGQHNFVGRRIAMGLLTKDKRGGLP
jgi:hypothetical protein